MNILFADLSSWDRLCLSFMVPFLLSGLVLVPYYIWKAKLAMNDPERLERFKKWERKEVERQKEAARKAAAKVRKAVQYVRRLRKK